MCLQHQNEEFSWTSGNTATTTTPSMQMAPPSSSEVSLAAAAKMRFANGGGGGPPAKPSSSSRGLVSKVVESPTRQDSKSTTPNSAKSSSTASTASTRSGTTKASAEGSSRGFNCPLKERASFLPNVGEAPQAKREVVKQVILGVMRLDYEYPPALGDIAHPGSFSYKVVYRVVHGLTFEMAQEGVLTPEVEREFVKAIRDLEMRDVNCITGDCGFMMHFQELARRHARKPVLMSALLQLPLITCSLAKKERIAIFTANGQSFSSMHQLLKDEFGVDLDSRCVFVGCEDVEGLEAVALAQKVDVATVTPGIVDRACAVSKEYPEVRAFLFECTELPPYSDAVRKATGMPVFDALTCCNAFIAGFKDNAFRFECNAEQQRSASKQQQQQLQHQQQLQKRSKGVPRTGATKA